MTITRGSGNVFEDIGFDPRTATELQCKSQLVTSLNKAMKTRNLSQTKAAEICGTDQPTLSKVLRGHLDKVSSDRLFTWLVRLGCMVRIKIDTNCDCPHPSVIVDDSDQTSAPMAANG